MSKELFDVLASDLCELMETAVEIDRISLEHGYRRESAIVRYVGSIGPAYYRGNNGLQDYQQLHLVVRANLYFAKQELDVLKKTYEAAKVIGR